MVPRLRAVYEYVGLGPEPARIIKRADTDSDYIWPSGYLYKQRSSAFAAECACYIIA